MTAAKKTKTPAKKTNDSSNYQSNGGNIGPTGPWALTPLGPPWVPLGPPWASLGPPWAPLPIRPPPKAAEGEKLTMKLIWWVADKFCLKTNLFGAWAAQGPFWGSSQKKKRLFVKLGPLFCFL